ncbi:MAG TPA: choice-of-anchor tandem repeat GloVer-containing protein, partial [Chitinophagales bacterium]|nr:choice-of-anchor tandem repeat GloVer-containing protein [Chitinophagales bacterium]
FTSIFYFEQNVSGNEPHGALLQASDGLLYGMTKDLGPGSNDAGTIFRYDIVADTFKILYDFIDTLNGKYPLGNLIEGTDGYLYGMTSQGGSFGHGVIFRFNKVNNQFSKLWDFDGALAGGNPQGSLLQASDGQLYGMTLLGGLNGKGVIFKFDPDLVLYEVIENFSANENGALPYGNLMEYHGPASVIYTMSDTVACFGSDLTLFAVATGGYLHYQWYHEGIMVGGDAQSLPLTSVNYADSGKYWCNIYNDLDSVVSDTIHVSVIDSGIASLTVIGSNVLCPYDAPVELTGTPAGGLYIGEGVYGNYFYPSYAGSGIHNVFYIYTYGCVLSDSLSLMVASLPAVAISSPNDTTVCLNSGPLALNATPAGGTFTGSGINGNLFLPDQADIGIHVIYYTYSDTCNSSDSIVIIVDVCAAVSAINSFNFEVAPNPFSDAMKIYLPQQILKGEAHFKLIDMFGHVAKHGRISSSEFILQRDHLPAGIYMLEVEYDSMYARKKVTIE